jgi:hypothetical protein
MENNLDLLQIKIKQAREILPQKSREAIDVSNWKTIISLELSGKYSEIQIQDLETETELLLCGLVSPKDYPNELESRMRLSKDAVKILIGEMDKLVFKKIQKELERKMDKENKVPYPNKESAIDPRFANLPKEIQRAIIESNYQVVLYSIAGKYKLSVEQMGILEEITIKVILGKIHPEKYVDELASRITIKKEDISNLVKDINENILKTIRESFKNHFDNSEVTEDNIVPPPPYKNLINKVENDDIPPPPYKNLINNEKSEVVNEKNAEKIEDIPKNIIEEKLKGVVVNEHTTSDYSDTKTSNTILDINKDNLTPTTKSPDPYRETF